MGAEPAAPPTPTPLRAWLVMVGLSIRRQARLRQMVWVALGLLAFVVVLVAAVDGSIGWKLADWPWRGRPAMSYSQAVGRSEVASSVLPGSPPAHAIQAAVTASAQAALRQPTGELAVFSRSFVFSLLLAFLIPLWTLSFATNALGSEREGRSLVWLLSRPVPRWAIYLAKFVGVLPWCLGLNLLGFGLMCLAAGDTGRFAFRLYWPAVAWGTLAFAALFHLFGAVARRPAVVALVYSFFLETLLGDMPGYLKRASLSFYTRCLMFDAAERVGFVPERSAIYQPVSGATAWLVLVGATVVLLGIGMYWFSRAEYHEDA